MTPSPLSRAQLAGRLSLIGLAVAGLAGAFAWTAGWIGPQRLTPQRIIDTFEANAGHYPGYRKNHAKGLCISGQFQSSGAATAYSRAQVFAPGDIPVSGRLAIGGSNPFAADASVPVRSLALRLRRADGQEWRTGMNSPAVLAVGTVEAFFEQVLASAPIRPPASPTRRRCRPSSTPTRRARPSASGPRPTSRPTASPTPATTASMPSAW